MTNQKKCLHNSICKIKRKRYLICLDCGQMFNWFMGPEWTKSFLPKNTKIIERIWRVKN